MGTKIPSGSDFTPISEDVHDAVCCEFKDLGIQPTPWGDKHQAILVFEVKETIEDGEREGQRKQSRCYFNLTWGGSSNPSKIRKILDSWRGKAMTAAERDEFELETLEGKACRLVIVHNEKEGRTYANIENVMKPGKSRIKPSSDYVRLDERNSGSDQEADDEEAENDGVPF